MIFLGNNPTASYINEMLFACFLLYTFLPMYNAECELMHRKNHDDSREKELLKILKPLSGVTYNVKDALSPENYTYKVGICGGMEHNVGAVQYSKNKNFTLGLYNMTDIIGGTDWIFLTYYGGDKYGSHCGNTTKRTTKIMIICDPNVFYGKMQILEERKFDRTESTNRTDCYYLFEVGSNVTCTPKKELKLPSKLSSGSVFCILFFTIISAYLFCGFLYQRIVIGAKGLEQIPNYSFWRDFGNLQADGCDFFCRCGPRQESQAYRGIDDHLKEEEERDDQLLNM